MRQARLAHNFASPNHCRLAATLAHSIRNVLRRGARPPADVDQHALAHLALEPAVHAEAGARPVHLIGRLEAWEHLGTWRLTQGNTDEGIAAFEQAVQVNPTHFAARFSLAEAYLEAERYEEAVRAYQEIIGMRNELDPDDLAAAYAGLADAYNSMERYDEAIATCQTLLEQFENDPEGYYQLATAYDALGRYDEAIANYENAIESDPLNADYYNDFADTLREVKRYEEALEMARQAIALDPSMVLAYETLAQIYEEMGRPEDAAAAMEQANALRVAEA